MLQNGKSRLKQKIARRPKPKTIFMVHIIHEECFVEKAYLPESLTPQHAPGRDGNGYLFVE